MMKKFSLPHQSYTGTQCDRIEEMKTPLAFRFAILFCLQREMFRLGNDIFYYIPIRIAAKYVWYGRNPSRDLTDILVNSVTGRQNVNNQTHLEWPEMSRPNKCQRFHKNVTLISDDIQLRLYHKIQKIFDE